jgi:predicted permease
MRTIGVWLLRLADLFRKERRDHELDAELQSHLQFHIEDNLRLGMTTEEARRQALITLGGLDQTKESYRNGRGFPSLDSLMQDVRFGLRMLRKNPGFTTVAVLTLALGIGANTAIFSVVNGVLLAPLPYRQPDRLVAVWETDPRFPLVGASYPNFLDRQREARSFEQMAALAQQAYDLAAPGSPEHIDGEEVSAGLFSTLGVTLSLGRDFSPAEDTHGGAPVAIISNRIWRNRYGTSPSVLGQSIVLSGVAYTIVGVAPPNFAFSVDSDVYTPLGQADPLDLKIRGDHWLASVARLRKSVSLSQAQAELSTVQSRVDQLYPDDDRDIGVALMPLKQWIVGRVSGTLLLLLGAVGLVLLIACANVASLLLARAASRRGEFATRAALGASRGRVVRQLVTESVLLSLAGAALGVLVAVGTVRPVLSILPAILPRSENIGVDLPVLLFTLGLAILTGVTFGLAPARKISRADLQASLQSASRGLVRGHHRGQGALVIVQIALTLVLLAGAGLLFRTIRRLWQVNPGFDAQHLITFKVDFPHLTTPAGTRSAYQQLIARIRRVPGVEAAEFTSVVPFTRASGTIPFWINSRKPASVQAAPRLVAFLTGPDYLQTMKIPIIRGRFFTLHDTVKSQCVVAIDAVFARLYFPHNDPLGQTLTFGFSPASPAGPCIIVGIVGHVRDWELGNLGANVQNQMYFPLYQDPDQWVSDNYPDESIVVRTSLPFASVLPAIRASVYSAAGDQPIFNVQTIEQIASKSMSTQRFPMLLLVAFASLALVLACVGIYGVISYSVAQHVHEIGIRMALGAERWSIFRAVIAQGLRLVLAGLAIGVVVAMVLARLLSGFSHLLYGVSADDPSTFVAVSVVLLAVALVACYVPARRAMRIDPMVALRHE